MAKDGLANLLHVAEHKMFDSIEKEVKDYDDFLATQTKSLKEISNDYQHLKEYYECVKTAANMLKNAPKRQATFGYYSHERSFEKDGGRDQEEGKEKSKAQQNKQQEDRGYNVKIGHIIGTISTNELFSFKRLIFRATRGNALVLSEDIKSKKHEEKPKESLRSTFIITYQEGRNMKEKLQKISTSFNSRVFDYPEQNPQNILEDLLAKIKDTRKLLKDSNRELRNYLIRLNDLESKRKPGGNSPFYGISTLPMYRMFVLIEEEIYRNMNCLKSIENGNIKYGFVWSRTPAQGIITELHNKGHYLPELHFHDVLDHDFETPTYIRTNEFTSQFQAIVDTYGVPKYKEINPTVFTIVSFPFLFGVMFGDIGHGSILFLFASFICLFGNKISALRTLYNTRYLLLLMGFFSTFCGFMYNDFMSLPLELNRSCYVNKGVVAVQRRDCVYPFGVDHKWYVASNELVFMNSLKMKLAVIFGVAQMLLGIFLKSLNAVYHHDFIEYLFEFWPQFILMWCWFGYMDILIIGKWLTDYKDTSIAPSIIASMIDMFLKFGAVEKEPILASRDTSERINVALLLVSMSCIPLMLLVRPIHSMMTHQKHEERDSRLFGVENIVHTKQITKKKDGFYQFEDEPDLHGDPEEDKDAIDREIKREEQVLHYDEFVRTHSKHLLKEEAKRMEEEKESAENMFENGALKRRQTALVLEEKDRHDQAMHHLKKCLKTEHKTHSLEEIFVHQLIETIEFVLGTVSNTASYLRLWALSLAHSQLAAVFYEKTLELGLATKSSIVLFLVQQGFWAATLGVLMSMDALECFLHTLRLHWVEFQNKFYKGTGTKFKPLSFRQTAIKE